MRKPRIPKTGVPGKSRPKAKDDPKRSVPKHLAWIRTLPCVAGLADIKGYGCLSFKIEAAHVRSGTDGGAGLKPSDRWTVPLCSRCHKLQHSVGENKFWSFYQVDPVALAERLWRVSGDTEQGLRAIERARKVEAR